MVEVRGLEIHLLNWCKCRECTRIRLEVADAHVREQLYWHETKDQICCGDCPECWHHF
jgi:hypothetical protein